MSKILWRCGVGMLGLALVAGGCQHGATGRGGATMAPATTQGAGGATAVIADIPSAELQDMLAGFSRSHEQKMQLAWWISTPLRPVGAPFAVFYETVGREQKQLQAELTAWAKQHDVDLTYRPSKDTMGRALKMMEDRQEKMVRADNRADFERDMLMQMYNDHEWQICQIQALLPRVKEAGLRAYLEHSLKVHQAASADSVGLLKRFKFVG